MGFAGSSVVENWPVTEGCLNSGSGRSPGEGNGNPLPVVLPGKFRGQRNMVGCSPWGL